MLQCGCMWQVQASELPVPTAFDTETQVWTAKAQITVLPQMCVQLYSIAGLAVASLASVLSTIASSCDDAAKGTSR